MDWNELIGKRALIKTDFWVSTANEYTVWDVSPSKEWVKLKCENEYTFWHEAKRLMLIEVLE
ncbi:MAG: hypothetical protein ACYSW6_10380 [Planctomycetota bacterium]